jgi:UDP-N-acetylglucosamine 1-carboxyvinyltransferase
MGRLEIEGLKPLAGDVEVSGAKNEALKVVPFSILTDGEFALKNVPDIADIRKQLEIFEDLGGKYTFKDNLLRLDGTDVTKTVLKNGLATKLRASVVFLGPLLARFSRVTIPFPGGCTIGMRPIDSHLEAFKALGAEVECREEAYHLTFKDFKSKKIKLTEQSVTATENILLFLSNFDDDFVVSNCAIEPEVIGLVDIMNKAGAKITVQDREFRIRGSKNLALKEAEIIPDRIEAFSYLVGFIITGGQGKIKNFPAEYMELPLKKLKEAGAKFKLQGSTLIVERSSELKPFTIKTETYPGFPTDMQSPMSLIAAFAYGKSKITESMFENRLGYIKELQKMGLVAGLIDKHNVEISGPSSLVGARIEALDLRSGITLVLAALAADGKSVIDKGEVIDRGYEDLTKKLTGLGAKVKKYD